MIIRVILIAQKSWLVRRLITFLSEYDLHPRWMVRDAWFSRINFKRRLWLGVRDTFFVVLFDGFWDANSSSSLSMPKVLQYNAWNWRSAVDKKKLLCWNAFVLPSFFDVPYLLFQLFYCFSELSDFYTEKRKFLHSRISLIIFLLVWLWIFILFGLNKKCQPYSFFSNSNLNFSSFGHPFSIGVPSDFFLWVASL